MQALTGREALPGKTGYSSRSAGHQAEWVFPPELTYDRGKAIGNVSFLTPAQREAHNRMAHRSTLGRIVLAKAEVGTGDIVMAYKRLISMDKFFRVGDVTKKEAKLALAMVHLSEEGQRLGISHDDNE